MTVDTSDERMVAIQAEVEGSFGRLNYYAAGMMRDLFAKVVDLETTAKRTHDESWTYASEMDDKLEIANKSIDELDRNWSRKWIQDTGDLMLERQELLAMLRRLEWGFGLGACPACNASEHLEHEPDCELDAILRDHGGNKK